MIWPNIKTLTKNNLRVKCPCILSFDRWLSSLLPSLLLLASFFFRFEQPKAQHCVPRCLPDIVSVLLPIHNCTFWGLPIWRRLKIASFKNHWPKTIGCAIQSYFEISDINLLHSDHNPQEGVSNKISDIYDTKALSVLKSMGASRYEF